MDLPPDRLASAIVHYCRDAPTGAPVSPRDDWPAHFRMTTLQRALHLACNSSDPRSGSGSSRGWRQSDMGADPVCRPGRFAMSKAQPTLPDMLPLLSRGKHRNPVRARVSWSWCPTLAVSDGAIFRRVRIRCWHRWRDWSTTTPPTRGAPSRRVDSSCDRADRGRPEHRCLGQPPVREDRAAGCGSRSTAGPGGLGAGLREGVGTTRRARGEQFVCSQ
jgi:hypothetical protein